VSQELTLLHGSERRSARWHDDQGFSFALDLEPGLYTVTLQTDMRRFDWDRLYYPMTKFRNQGQRTGPWDFDIYHENVPLLPAWRVHRDGAYLGLLYMQRPSLEVVESQCARAQFDLCVRTRGTVEIACTPLNQFRLDPIALTVEADAFDRMEEQPWTARGLEANWAWQANAGWDALAARIRHTEWETFLEQALAAYDRSRQKSADPGGSAPPCPADALGLYALAYRCFGKTRHLETVADFVRHSLAQPAWGNPNPDGYGHNGDMGCGLILKQLAFAYNWVGEQLGPLRAELLAFKTRHPGMDEQTALLGFMELKRAGAGQSSVAFGTP